MESVKLQFNRFVNWLDSHGEKFHTSPQEKRKTSILIRASVLTGVFMLLYIGNCIFIEFTLGIQVLPFEAAIFFSLPFWIKFGIKPKIIAHLYILNGTFFGVLLVVFSGGLQSPVTAWLTLMPICAILFMDAKNAFLWAYIILGVIVAMGIYWLLIGPFPFNYNEEKDAIYFLNCYAGLIFIYLFLSLIFEKRLNVTIDELEINKNSLELSNNKLNSTILNLKKTQSQLIQSEKMASLGELTAGIAHEIQNPLNFVNNFSEVSEELLSELKEELEKGDIEEARVISNLIILNLQKINHHGHRASNIVKGMLEHSKASSGKKELVDINHLAEEYLKLSFHGLQAKSESFNAEFKTDFDPKLMKIEVVPQDIGRVLLNLINNAFQASTEFSQSTLDEASKTSDSNSKHGISFDHKPIVIVATKKTEKGIEISIKDNGPGIPDAIKDKIFQPFFTTKDSGKGTGLGLSLAYDIVKAHGGEIKVKSKESEGSEFIISLPV